MKRRDDAVLAHARDEPVAVPGGRQNHREEMMVRSPIASAANHISAGTFERGRERIQIGLVEGAATCRDAIMRFELPQQIGGVEIRQAIVRSETRPGVLVDLAGEEGLTVRPLVAYLASGSDML